MAKIGEEIGEIKSLLIKLSSEVSEVKITSKLNLEEAKRTNGRVTKLEDKSSDLDKRVSLVENNHIHLKEDFKEISPKVDENKTFITSLRGNWKGIATSVVIIGYLIEKGIELLK